MPTMITNKALIFKAIPTGIPVANEHIAVEDRSFDMSADPPAGGLTVRNHYVSLDPYQRGCLREDDDATWATAYVVDKPIVNGTVARVLKSDVARFKAGDVVWGLLPVEEYSHIPASLMDTIHKVENPLGLDLRQFATSRPGNLGASASGAVGSMVGQLAKRENMRVIGSTGSDEKLRYVTNELRFDDCFNYKKESPANALQRLAPDGIDVYFDNVGGDHLEAALNNLKPRGRVVLCGMVSQYNKPPDQRYGIKNLLNAITQSLKICGFVISDASLVDKYSAKFGTDIYSQLAAGKIKAKLHVTSGIEHAVEGFLEMFSGGNFGKAVLEIAPLEL